MNAVGGKFFGWEEKKNGKRALLHPNNTFLVKKIVDHLDALTHLGLSLIGHWENGANELSRLHVFQGGNSIAGSGVEVWSKAGQWEPPDTCLSALPPVS
ncbi:MAG: hypothetical protein LZF86_110386 [Nitrospira sp.]|nr:MAG: hypothetical protein LZF86_110386 [Nitrospira sp.]